MLIYQVLYFRNLKLLTHPIPRILFLSGLRADREGVFTSLKARAGHWRHNPKIRLLVICPRTILPAPTKREGYRYLTASLLVMANNKCHKRKNNLRSSSREMNASCHFHKMKCIMTIKGFTDGSVVKNPPAHERRRFGSHP